VRVNAEITGEIPHVDGGQSPGTEPRSTAQIAVQPGAPTRKVPSELGRWEFLKLHSSQSAPSSQPGR
ncbi:MAG TPA: hypothetical protein VF070_40300, partial [Streptosporangiaceae bacterium]